jgi:hypothetical protein
MQDGDATPIRDLRTPERVQAYLDPNAHFEATDWGYWLAASDLITDLNPFHEDWPRHIAALVGHIHSANPPWSYNTERRDATIYSKVLRIAVYHEIAEGVGFRLATAVNNC